MTRKTRLKLIIYLAITVIFLNYSFALAGTVTGLGDNIEKKLQNVAGGEKGAGFSATADKPADLAETTGSIIQTVLTFLGVIFLVLIIYGGFMWMTAHGSEDKVSKAKNLITEAIIGLAIVLGAYLITYYVVSAFIEKTGFQQP